MANTKLTATETALRLLERKDYSRAGLTKMLLQKGYDEGEIQRVLETFTPKKYLDDTRFAEEGIRHMRENGKGRLYIERWLTEQGVDAELIRKAMFQGFPVEAEVDYVKKLLEVHQVPETASDEVWKERKRRYRRLVAAGFSQEALEACGYGDDGT